MLRIHVRFVRTNGKCCWWLSFYAPWRFSRESDFKWILIRREVHIRSSERRSVGAGHHQRSSHRREGSLGHRTKPVQQDLNHDGCRQERWPNKRFCQNLRWRGRASGCQGNADVSKDSTECRADAPALPRSARRLPKRGERQERPNHPTGSLFRPDHGLQPDVPGATSVGPSSIRSVPWLSRWKRLRNAIPSHPSWQEVVQNDQNQDQNKVKTSS